MKRLRVVLPLVVVSFLMSLIMLTQVGCEEAKGVGGLEVDPATVTLGTNDASVVITVVGGIADSSLAMPLAWEVSNASLGQITASSGLTAVYRRLDANGVNTVTVRDQFGKEGYATITQRAVSYSFRLVADPSSIRPNQGATVRIEGDDAEAPFRWQLVSGPGSLAASSGSRSASYAAGSSTGVAQILVTDANGVSASVAISVTVAETGNGGTAPGPGTDPDLGF